MASSSNRKKPEVLHIWTQTQINQWLWFACICLSWTQTNPRLWFVSILTDHGIHKNSGSFFFLMPNSAALVLVAAPGVSVSCRIFCCGAQALWLWLSDSAIAAHELSCPTACGIFVPQPEIEPTSPALRGGFLTTDPPGSPNPGLPDHREAVVM